MSMFAVSAEFPSVAQMSGLSSAAVNPASSGAPVAVPTSGYPKLWSPHSAMFWFAAFAAATVGLIATTVDVKVGPVHASASAGKS